MVKNGQKCLYFCSKMVIFGLLDFWWILVTRVVYFPRLFFFNLETFNISRTTGVHLNIWAGPNFAFLVWTVPPIYKYWSGRPVWYICVYWICIVEGGGMQVEDQLRIVNSANLCLMFGRGVKTEQRHHSWRW